MAYSLSVIMLMVLSMPVYAESTALAEVGVTIVDPVTVQNLEPMQFGIMSVGALGGEVVLGPDDERRAKGDVALHSGKCGGAVFLIHGTAGANYSIALPDQCILENIDKREQVIVDNFISESKPLGEDISNGIILYVGGTLHVAPRQAIGKYTGHFTITVTYQ